MVAVCLHFRIFDACGLCKFFKKFAYLCKSAKHSAVGRSTNPGGRGEVVIQGLLKDKLCFNSCQNLEGLAPLNPPLRFRRPWNAFIFSNFHLSFLIGVSYYLLRFEDLTACKNQAGQVGGLPRIRFIT